MKKKLLCFAMVLCLLAGSTMSVSAAQLFGDGETADVQITYDNPSTFCVNIPASINLNDSAGYTFTADSMCITDAEKVCIYAPEDSIQMTNEYGLKGTARLYGSDYSNCVATFLRDQTTASSPMNSMFDGVSAGHYEGTVTFTVRLEPNTN